MAQCKVVIKNLDDLELAAARLGGTLKRGQTSIRWYGHFVDDSKTWREFFTPEEAARVDALPREQRKSLINKEMSRADHAIVFKGASYDVGVMQEKDGTFRLRWDQYAGGGGLNTLIGNDGGKFSQAYAIEAAKRAARRKGFSIREEAQPNGHIKLKLLIQ